MFPYLIVALTKNGLLGLALSYARRKLLAEIRKTTDLTAIGWMI